MFWWYNMYSGADIGVTPRPIYCADGRKLPDCYSAPAELRDELTKLLGPFPLFSFWGPATTIASRERIARAPIHVRKTRKPTLTLIYLPHLDYGLQRVGPDDPSIATDLRAVDDVCGELIANAEQDGARIIVLSEYGITAVNRPIHINRALRDAGLLAVREELGRELLDPGASQATASLPSASTIRVRANSWRYPTPIAGSPTIIGSMTTVPPTLPALSRSIASQATTLLSCSSILRSAFRSLRLVGD